MYSICKNIATIHNYKKYDEKEFKKILAQLFASKNKNKKKIHVYYSRICCLIEIWLKYKVKLFNFFR